MKSTSNTVCLDRLISRMWEIRDKLNADPGNPSLQQQWEFIRRVVAKAVTLRN